MVGGFFPTPYPDECYYSLLCRYFVHSGSGSKTRTIFELFGNAQRLSTAVFFPSRMECVPRWIPPESGITRKTIALKHTMYPYLFISCNPEFREEMTRVLDGGKIGKGVDLTGVKKSRRLLPKYLKFCPLCAGDDERSYGETFWHRTHQLPGVEYCTKHHVRLVNSGVSCKDTATSFCAASDENLSKLDGIGRYDNFAQFKERFLKIGKESEWLLNHSMDIDCQFDVLEKYKRLFREKGISSVHHGLIHYDSLATGLDGYWGEEFLKTLYSETGDTKGWIFGFHRQRADHFKPLYHILLMCFLKETVEEFLKYQLPENLFGDGLWPCENPVCQHPIVKNTGVQYTNGGATGHFLCESCGMRYKRIKKREGTTEAIIVDYGFLWKDKLKHCLGVEKMTMPEAAEILKCKLHIIQWQKKKLGINTNEYLSSPRKYDAETGTEAFHKSIVLDLLDQNKIVTPQYLKNYFPGTYSYFCVNDFAWLRAHIVYAKDLDCWIEEDRNLLKKVQNAVEYIKGGDNKRHLTRAYIAQIAGIKLQSLNTAKKRPLTKAYVDEIVESRETWLRRRIFMLHNYRRQSGFSTTSFAMVKRNLSLKPNTYITYRELIEDVLNELNQNK